MKILLEEARVLLSDVPPGSRVTLGTAPRTLSQAIGQKKENLRLLESEFALRELKIVPADAKEGEIVILSLEKGGEV